MLDEFCDAGYSALSRNSPFWGTPEETMVKVLQTLEGSAPGLNRSTNEPTEPSQSSPMEGTEPFQ
ncbi:MAG: hypothetical protein CMN76_12355 [Spirochaetaceae bacterium]|nr:hypothetical protein [Spirochaetaceae bacterium]